MTSFAFIAGLIPLVFATGPGAIGNRTIGAASAGGMLLGTICGVLLIPGLYYVFGKVSEKKIFVRDQRENPLTEEIDNHTEKEQIEDYV
jgi:HAE1 family hydrophobic/amphiphilic exporter-1